MGTVEEYERHVGYLKSKVGHGVMSGKCTAVRSDRRCGKSKQWDQPI